jgi:mannan endo-1,4-beta-mannosidase
MYVKILKAGIALAIICCMSGVVFSQQSKPDWPIITRKGDQLFEGEKLFRFFGLAAPNIQQNESQIREDRSNRFPDEFEIRDILSGLQLTGSRATRTFSLSVHHPDDKDMPVYISARRMYNEAAFQCLDRAIALAHDYDVRLIIPFIASQSFGGIRGVDEFGALAGKPPGAFWTDAEVKADFKHFLSFILNRKNTVNGILYKNDPAILCWQLGNEFGSYAGDRKLPYEEWTPKIEAWCTEMAAYIKTQDPNHLIMEAGGGNRSHFLKDPNIDIISEHLYEYWNRMGGKPWDLSPIAIEARMECKGIKPLMIDEFGLGGTENLRRLMQTIRENDIAGGLLWSIRGRRRDGGWYYHNEGGTPVNSYHVPGFAVGFVYEEARMLQLLRKEAYAIRNMQAPSIKPPSPEPVLMVQGHGFTWRGSAGAAYYTIERADKPEGPFTVIATGLHDAVIADVANFEYTAAAQWPQVLYTDESAKKGTIYYYRIQAMNEAGASAYSPILKYAIP